jgi:hypothetical protein
MNSGIRLLAPFLLLLGTVAAEEENKIYLAANQITELIAKEGQKVIVHGETEGSSKSASGTNFVNFKGSEFFLVTFKSDLEPFRETEPHLAYDKKRLAVEGTIALYQGKPQIKLTDPKQVTVLAPDAVFPPPVAKEKEDETTATADKKMTPVPATNPAPEPAKPKPPVDPSEYFKK